MKKLTGAVRSARFRTGSAVVVMALLVGESDERDTLAEGQPEPSEDADAATAQTRIALPRPHFAAERLAHADTAATPARRASSVIAPPSKFDSPRRTVPAASLPVRAEPPRRHGPALAEPRLQAEPRSPQKPLSLPEPESTSLLAPQGPGQGLGQVPPQAQAAPLDPVASLDQTGPAAAQPLTPTPTLDNKPAAAPAEPTNALSLPVPSFGVTAATPQPIASTLPPTAAAASGGQETLPTGLATQADAQDRTTADIGALNADRSTDPAARASRTGSASYPDAVPTLSPTDELIFELRLPNGDVVDTILAYGTRAGVFLPLGALARTLDLAITVSPNGTEAEGWVLAEDRTLRIDASAGTLVLSGKHKSLQAGRVVAHDGEMYVRDDYLASLLPLSLATDLRDSAITLTTREPFPFQERLAREERRARLDLQARAQNAGEDLPRQATPWRMVDVPLTDMEVRAASDSAFGSRAEADMRLTSDLAMMSAQLFASGNTRYGLTAARLELGRRDADGALLGPLAATQFALGDVATATLPLGLRGAAGRGLTLSNAPLQQASIFEKIDLRGELPDGYEVELYRNNVLIGSTRQASNGRFEFLQIPVEFGLNVMRLAFYGPQGQRRDEVRLVTVGDGRLPQGKLVYNLGIAEKDRSLFNVYGPNYVEPRDFGKMRATAQLAYGLSSGLTTALHAARFGTSGGNAWQLGGGLRTGLHGLSARLDGAMQRGPSASGGGEAVELGLGARVLGAAVTLGHSEYRGNFVDEVQSATGDTMRRASELGATGSLSFGGGTAPFTLPYSARVRRLDFADGREQLNATLRTAARIGTTLAAASLDYQQFRLPDQATQRRLAGLMDLTRPLSERTQMRLSLGYEFIPRNKPVSFNVEIDHALDDRTLVRASAGRSFDAGQTSLGLSTTRRFRQFSLSFDSALSVPDRLYSAVLRLGFSFGRNPLTGRTFFDQPGLAGAGAVALRAFRDTDGDGQFGANDIVLPEVAFGSGAGLARTDDAGVALIGDLPGGIRTSVLIDPDTLNDIDLAPRFSGLSIVPRPGRIHVADFPINEVREMQGVVLFRRDGKDQPLSGMRLELIDTASRTVAYARSNSSGWFLFEQVPQGQYEVRLEPEQAQRFGMEIAGTVRITIEAGKPPPGLTVIVKRTD